jgi:hypothetical protein
MHLFASSKKTLLLLTTLSMIALVVASLVASFATLAHATSHAPSSANTFHGTAAKVTLLSHTKPAHVTPPPPTPGTLAATKGNKPFAFTRTHLPSQAQVAAATRKSIKPVANSLTMSAKEGQLLHNFNSISDLDQAAANGDSELDAVTPPDQGLCVGRDPGAPGQTAVFATVNSAIRETGVDGGPLSGHPLLGNLDFSFAQFWEPNAFSDPRCFYDTSTKTFYFTVIGFMLSGPDIGQTSIDVAVYNANGFAVYQVDSSNGGQFFGDQPHVGYDNNNLYLATDSFSATSNDYFGATLFILSKSQLVAEASSVAEDVFGEPTPLSLGGIPILTLEPAISTSSTNTEFLLNSFPFLDADITPNPVSHQLGFWQVDNGAELSKGHPEKVSLEGKIIQSETYAFPVPATSTGDGSVTTVTEEGFQVPVQSETALNPDDDRMLQVQFVNGHLWAALTTAVSIGSDPVARDGAAWFEINTDKEQVVHQGYIASKGNYLIYPAILHSAEGTTAITFTITSATINPSAAYVVRKEDASQFGSIQTVAAGAGPHLSFAGPLFNSPRWGDYSAAAFSTDTNNIWMATEYIPPVASQNGFDNWGTRVFEVEGNH